MWRSFLNFQRKEFLNVKKKKKFHMHWSAANWETRFWDSLYRVSQNVGAPLKVQIERNLMNKNDLSTIGPRSLDQAQINNNVKPIRT